MENQELFDKYIQGALSKEDKANFESKLNADKAFASDFKMFLLVIKGIQDEEAQDCADFGAAMKKLSKKQLQEIIGAKAKPKVEKYEQEQHSLPYAAFETHSMPRANKKGLKISPWVWSSLSAAAVVAIVVTISFNLINQSQLDMNNTKCMAYNVIAEYNFIDGGSRGSSEDQIIDFAEVDEDELKEKLSLYEAGYSKAQGEQIVVCADCAPPANIACAPPIDENDLKETERSSEGPLRHQVDQEDVESWGLNLAMIYLRLHDKDKALKILKELQAQYPESINNYKRIITQIESLESKR